MKYIIKVSYSFLTWSKPEYIGSKTFIHQGEKYAVLTKKENAKRYSSEKIAENSIKKLKMSCSNLADCEFEIEEVGD